MASDCRSSTGARLIALASGRKSVLPARMTTVRTVASAAESDAGQGADSRRTPKGCGGIQTRDLRALFEDDARAEKADAGDDIGSDLGRARLPINSHPQGDERGGAHGDKHVGPQARAPLPPLAFRADERREDEGDQNADGEIKQMAEVKIPDDRHRPPRKPIAPQNSGLTEMTRGINRQMSASNSLRSALHNSLKRHGQ